MAEAFPIPNKIEKPEQTLYSQITQELKGTRELLARAETDFTKYEPRLEKIDEILWKFWDSGKESNPRFLGQKLESCNFLIQVQQSYHRLRQNEYEYYKERSADENDCGAMFSHSMMSRDTKLFNDLAEKAESELMRIFFDMNTKERIVPEYFLKEANPEELGDLLISCNLLMRGNYADSLILARDFLKAQHKMILEQTKKPEFGADKVLLQKKLKSIMDYSQSKEFRFLLAKMKKGVSRDSAKLAKESQRQPKIDEPDFFQKAKPGQINVRGLEYELAQYTDKLREGKSFFTCLNGLNNFHHSLLSRQAKLNGYLTNYESDEEIDRLYSNDNAGYHRCEADYEQLKEIENTFFQVLSKELIKIKIDDDFDNSLIVKNGQVIAELMANFIRHARLSYYGKPEEIAANQKVINTLLNLAKSPKICRLLNKYLDKRSEEFFQAMFRKRSLGLEIAGFEILDSVKSGFKFFADFAKKPENKERLLIDLALSLAESRGKDEHFEMDDVKDHIYRRLNLKPEEIKAEKIIRQALENYGLDAIKTLNAWETISEELIPYSDNLVAIMALEKKQPGIVKYLQENFNIVHFNRYPPELLIAQYEEQKLQRKKNPYVVIINPYSDWNGTFVHGRERWYKLFGQLQGQHLSLKVVEAGDKNDIAEQLAFLYKSFGRAIGGFLGGHGQKDSINFGATAFAMYDPQYSLHSEDLTVGVKGFVRNFFEENATLVLTSCSTGTPGGIAEELSKTGLKVIGPDRPTAITNITPVYDQARGTLDFQILYRKISPSGLKKKSYHDLLYGERPEKTYHAGRPVNQRPRPHPDSS